MNNRGKVRGKKVGSHFLLKVQRSPSAHFKHKLLPVWLKITLKNSKNKTTDRNIEKNIYI